MKAKKQKEAIKKVSEYLLSLAPDEFEAELKKSCEKAVEVGFCWGAAILYGQDPTHPRKGLCEHCPMIKE